MQGCICNEPGLCLETHTRKIFSIKEVQVGTMQRKNYCVDSQDRLWEHAESVDKNIDNYLLREKAIDLFQSNTAYKLARMYLKNKHQC